MVFILNFLLCVSNIFFCFKKLSINFLLLLIWYIFVLILGKRYSLVFGFIVDKLGILLIVLWI